MFATELIIPSAYFDDPDFVQQKPGRKCTHGVYIPSTQEDQSFAENCDVCKSLIAYMKFTGLELADIELRTRLLWTRLERPKKEKKNEKEV